MANRRDFFFKQRVTEGELDDSNLQLELADHDIKKDAFCGPNGYLMAAVTVVSVATSLQVILRGAAQLAKLTDAEWDDRAVSRVQKVVDKTLAAARAVATGDPDMFKKLAGILRGE